MGVYVNYYPCSDQVSRFGVSIWPEFLRCLKEVNEKDFKLLLDIPKNGILDEDQVEELVEAFEENEPMIHSWFFDVDQNDDYPFYDALDTALFGFFNEIRSLNEDGPGIICFSIPDDLKVNRRMEK